MFKVAGRPQPSWMVEANSTMPFPVLHATLVWGAEEFFQQASQYIIWLFPLFSLGMTYPLLPRVPLEWVHFVEIITSLVLVIVFVG